MKKWSKIASMALVALIAINIAATAYYFVQIRQIRQAKPRASLAESRKFPMFSGIDLKGSKWKAGDAPCRVIRITDDHCAFCKKDKPSYEKIIAAARNASCEIIEMAPNAGAMAYDPRPGIVQLKFVDSDIGSVLYPFVTPQTIILDRDWTVKMTRRAIFDEKSLAAGLAILGSWSTTAAR
jgi:hypothetical protein